MQIVIRLIPETPVSLPFSYFDRLSAAVYDCLTRADAEFSRDLHDGDQHANRIKLFSFSPLHSRMTEVHKPDKKKKTEGALVFKGPTFFKLSSPWPELMNRIGEGMLTTGNLRIGSQIFQVAGANLLPPPTFSETMIWRPTKTGSIVTSWTPKSKQQKIYAFPDTPADGQACEALVRTNLVHKWQRLCEIRPDIAASWAGKEDSDLRETFSPDDLRVEFIPPAKNNDKPYRTRLHYIKNNPVRSWHATLKITAPVPLQRTAWACGLGEMNSTGFGLVEELNRS